MLTDLRIQRDMFVLESFSVEGTNALLKSSFSNFVSDFTGYVNNFLGQFSTKEPALNNFSGKQKDLMKELMKHSYMDIAPLRAYVPEGLIADYLAYAKILDHGVDHASGIITNTLNPYSKFLSEIITTSNKKFGSDSFDNIYTSNEERRKLYNKEQGACFKNGSTTTETTVGQVVRRNADWGEVFHMVNDMTTDINSVERTVITKKVKECVELLETISNKIKRGELEGASQDTVKNLANGCYEVAKELEFYVAMHYKVTALTTSVNRTVDHFLEVFKQ